MVLFTFSLDTFRGSWGGCMLRFYAEFNRFGRGLFTSTTFYLEKLFFCTYCCFLSLFNGRLLPLDTFFSYDLYLSLYIEEFIFLYGIVYNGFYFFFILICWDEPLGWITWGRVSYFLPFCWISLLISFKSYDALTLDFLLLVEQFENKSSAYYA